MNIQYITRLAFYDELEKISSIIPLKDLTLIGSGALGLHYATKANRDRKMGKQIRLQQQQGM